MSETSQEARRALTEERGKVLDKWWAINNLRFMKFQDPISPTLSDMPSEILVQVFEKFDSIEH
ncbi:F-box domain-containing protein [Caenorhabditis elegans]|uniref:F-box domain-containing protein n=1 Tax=Caenorhabditis elegans TaxID=6239 RepID=A0A679L8U2_CAEEL|nr:Uncharacterized protein CELE_CTEL54X.2 [Caenorhabditis elegans]CAA9991458.1 Uncharacterized protein CELE_CTEL54X.2 [Caenorhabditis elegans]